MESRHLEVLRELAERGSVTAVAAATHRTPSAVSQQLKLLQRDVGVRLVEPSGRGVRLTEAGRVLADGAVDVATALTRAQARLDALWHEATGTVTIGSYPSAAALLVPAVITALAGEGIVIECRDADLVSSEFGALTADFDIVLGHTLDGDPPYEGLVSVTLLREPLDIALPADHRLVTKLVLSPDDLMGERWIGVPEGFPFDLVLDRLGARTDRPPTVVQRLKENRVVEAFVAAGHGIALLPRFTTITPEGIVLRPVRGIRAGRYTHALMRPDRAERLVVRRALDALTTVARSITGD